MSLDSIGFPIVRFSHRRPQFARMDNIDSVNKYNFDKCLSDPFHTRPFIHQWGAQCDDGGDNDDDKVLEARFIIMCTVHTETDRHTQLCVCVCVTPMGSKHVNAFINAACVCLCEDGGRGTGWREVVILYIVWIVSFCDLTLFSRWHNIWLIANATRLKIFDTNLSYIIGQRANIIFSILKILFQCLRKRFVQPNGWLCQPLMECVKHPSRMLISIGIGDIREHIFVCVPHSHRLPIGYVLDFNLWQCLLGTSKCSYRAQHRSSTIRGGRYFIFHRTVCVCELYAKKGDSQWN